MAKTFIIMKRGGMRNGRCNRNDGFYIVGASNAKQAINLVRHKIDPSGSFSVAPNQDYLLNYHFGSTKHQTTKGLVTKFTRQGNPEIEIDGRIYLLTQESRIENGVFQQKFVAVGSRANNPIVLWR